MKTVCRHDWTVGAPYCCAGAAEGIEQPDIPDIPTLRANNLLSIRPSHNLCHNIIVVMSQSVQKQAYEYTPWLCVDMCANSAHI